MEQIKLIFTNIGLNSVIDIALVYYVLYHGYMLIRDMRAKQLVKGIGLLIVLIPISQIFHLYMVKYILDHTFQVGVIALVVVFQPEIRRALEYLGRTSMFSFTNLDKNQATSESVIKEIVLATSSLARQKIGALIIFEQKPT